MDKINDIDYLINGDTDINEFAERRAKELDDENDDEDSVDSGSVKSEDSEESDDDEKSVSSKVKEKDSWTKLVNDIHGNAFNNKEEQKDLIYIEKGKIMEEIDRIRDQIEQFDAHSKIKMPAPDENDSMDRLYFYLAILRERYSRIRFSNTAEDIIVGAACAIEDYYDGTHSLLGYYPNYKDFPTAISSRMGDLKYSISEIVGSVFNTYLPGSAWQVGFELLMQLIFYPILKKGNRGAEFHIANTR